MTSNNHNTVLVTGTTGFIGSYLIEELLKREVDIIASSRSFKKDLNNSWLSKFNYIQADLSERRKDWFSFFGKPDMLIHLAWESLPNYKELIHMEQNFPYNYFFIKNMVESGLKKVVVTGTCFEYGMRSGQLKEDIATKPDNPYAQAKDTLRKQMEKLWVGNNF